MSRRRDADVGQLFIAQHDWGLFITNIISVVSRVEAFIQECLVIAISSQPQKLSIIAKAGIPIDLFLEHENRATLLERFIAMRCQELMFAKPSDYLAKVSQVLSIEIPDEVIKNYIELKATRDLLVHNQGLINDLYVHKAGEKARGQIGDELAIDEKYFEEVIVAAKELSGAIQRRQKKSK